MCDAVTVRTEVRLAVVVARLEELLPGLSTGAAASGAQRRGRLDEYVSRHRPGWSLAGPAQPRSGDAVDVDHLMAFAGQHGGRVAAQQLGDMLDCQRDAAAALLAAEDVRIVDGDVVIVGTSSPRVIVVHHEGWIFDLELARF